MDPIAEIKRLYYAATKATIQKDLARAIELLKSLPDEDARERAAVYMDGLSQMRSEWSQAAAGGVAPDQAAKSTSGLRSRASAPPGAPARGRSGRLKASSRRDR